MVSSIHPPKSLEPEKNLLPFDRLLRWPEVEAIVGICRSHAHSLSNQLDDKGHPKFPRPRKLVPGGRASAWVESEIRSWVQQRISEADNNGPESV